MDTLSILVGMALCAVTLIVAYLLYRLALKKGSSEAETEALARILPSSGDDLSELLVKNFSVLNTYYTENLSQARTSSLASVSIAVTGFVVIVAGILIAFIGNQKSLGLVSSAAGIVSEAAATLFFRQNKVFLNQMQDSLKKLVSTQYLMTSVALSKELRNEEAMDAEIFRINEHLRELMNVLHGVKRD